MNLEDAIQEKVRRLPGEQQQQVLEFVENLEQNGNLAKPEGTSSTMENEQERHVELNELGMTSAQAADLRASLTTFEDWNDPEMDLYDDYDQNLASLKEKP
jgi:hypothetical protein